MNKYLACYLRLSQDDANSGDSNSIISQRQLIREYISSNGDLSNMEIVEFVDDGYSGTNFERPGVKQMLEKVKKGEVSCILVKDFSRFGRQYLEVSKFVEQIFPYVGVRFIAINDRYDSNSHKGTTAEIDVAVRNMINAMYSKDISKKIKSAKQTKIKQGVFMNAHAIYGYKKDAEDNNKLIVDEPAAAIVFLMFNLVLDGLTAFQIADKLNRKNIPPPSIYKKLNGCDRGWNTVDAENVIWTKAAVLRVLRDERYTGVFIGGKWSAGKLGCKKNILKARDEWVRIPNAHPAIISQELFEKVVFSISGQSRGEVQGNADRLLYKKVWCGYCGHMLRFRGDTGNPFYYCDTARYSKQQGCVRDKIREKELLDVVSTVIYTQIRVMLNYEKLCRKEKKKSNQGDIAFSGFLLKLEDEAKNLQLLKRKLYERYKKGEADRMEYLRVRDVLEVQLSDKKNEIEIHSAKRYRDEDLLSNERRSLLTLLKHESVTELDKKLADELIEAVYVYGSKRVEIKLKFADEPVKILESISNASEK